MVVFCYFCPHAHATVLMQNSILKIYSKEISRWRRFDYISLSDNYFEESARNYAYSSVYQGQEDGKPCYLFMFSPFERDRVILLQESHY